MKMCFDRYKSDLKIKTKSEKNTIKNTGNTILIDV